MALFTTVITTPILRWAYPEPERLPDWEAEPAVAPNAAPTRP